MNVTGVGSRQFQGREELVRNANSEGNYNTLEDIRIMRKNKIAGMVTALVLTAAMLTGCGSATGNGNAGRGVQDQQVQQHRQQKAVWQLQSLLQQRLLQHRKPQRDTDR